MDRSVLAKTMEPRAQTQAKKKKRLAAARKEARKRPFEQPLVLLA